MEVRDPAVLWGPLRSLKRPGHGIRLRRNRCREHQPVAGLAFVRQRGDEVMSRRTRAVPLVSTVLVSIVCWLAASSAAGGAQGQAPVPPLTAMDLIEIQQLASSHAYALDTAAGDGYLYAELFTPDGEAGTPLVRGRDALAALARQTAGDRGGPDHVRHFVMNHLIEPSSEGARGRQYVVMLEIRDDGGPGIILAGGFYDDRYVRTAAGWRFQKREFVPSRLGRE